MNCQIKDPSLKTITFRWHSDPLVVPSKRPTRQLTQERGPTESEIIIVVKLKNLSFKHSSIKYRSLASYLPTNTRRQVFDNHAIWGPSWWTITPTKYEVNKKVKITIHDDDHPASQEEDERVQPKHALPACHVH